MSTHNRSENPRSRGGGNSQQQHFGQPASGTKWGGKPPAMATAKFQAAKRQQATVAAKEAEYLGEPPSDPSLPQCRIVLPGGHRVPHGLDNAASLNGIRREHRVWITRPEHNVLQVISMTMSCLKAGVQAINWAIHDMRLSNEHLVTRFFVQQPTRAAGNAFINLKIGSRPSIEGTNRPSTLIAAITTHKEQMGGQIVQAAETLVALDKSITMRVNFGRLDIRTKKRGLGSDLSYKQFADAIKLYSYRGGASLNTRLSDTAAAEAMLQRLTDPKQHVFIGEEDVRYGCSVTLAIQDSELRAEIQLGADHKPQLSMARMTKFESSARLNWTVAAPDMTHDWNIEANAWDAVDDVPASLEALLKRAQLKFDYIDSTPLTSLKFPRIEIPCAAIPGRQISETRLQTTAIIPYLDTPWVIEVSATRAWKGANTSAQPEVYWGIQVHGAHWDGAINQVAVGERRKDWGEGFEYIWPGTGTWEDRFGSFLESILEIQEALEGSKPE